MLRLAAQAEPHAHDLLFPRRQGVHRGQQGLALGVLLQLCAHQVLVAAQNVRQEKLVAVGVEHIALDEGVVILTLRRERRKDRLLLLVQLVGVLARLERKCGHGQQRRYDDHHHRRVHYNICVAVLVAEQPLFLLVLQFDERRGGGHADRAFFGCGVSFVNVAANGAFEFFRCHILPYFASLTRFFLREMFASTT